MLGHGFDSRHLHKESSYTSSKGWHKSFLVLDSRRITSLQQLLTAFKAKNSVPIEYTGYNLLKISH